MSIVLNIFLFLTVLALSYYTPLWLRALIRRTRFEMELWDRCLKPSRLALLFALPMVFRTILSVGDQRLLIHISPFFISGFIIAVAWLLIILTALPRIVFLKGNNINDADNLRVRKTLTQFSMIEKIGVFIIVLLAICLVMVNFESFKTVGLSLLASAGIMGIIIGLAAQKTLGNVLAGIQIAIAQPIRIDDVVIMQNEWGRIEEINLTYVVMRIWDQRRLVVPISEWIDKPFQNWTRTSAELLGSIFLYVDYTFPVESLRKELERILPESQYWDGRVGIVQVTDITERSMQLRVLVSSKDSPSAWDLRCFVREKLMAYIVKNFPEQLPRLRIKDGVVPMELNTDNLDEGSVVEGGNA